MESRAPGRVKKTMTTDGPSLEQYVETRLNLLTASMHDALAAADKRYEQRFEASQKALDLGFAGQKAAVDAAFAAQKEAINAALAAADRAVLKAELATEKRFESVNEFRGTLDNQQRTLIPRSEVAAIVKGLDEKIANLKEQFDKIQNDRSGQISERRGVVGGWGYAVGAIGFVLLIVAWVMKLKP